MLDISFREDSGRVRKANAAENFPVFSHIALNLLKSVDKFLNAVTLAVGMYPWIVDSVASKAPWRPSATRAFRTPPCGHAAWR